MCIVASIVYIAARTLYFSGKEINGWAIASPSPHGPYADATVALPVCLVTNPILNLAGLLRC